MSAWKSHIFQFCVCHACMRFGFLSGGKQSERTGGHNNHQNWGIVQDMWCLGAQTRRQKWDRHCFWKLDFFQSEVFPQGYSPPTIATKHPQSQSKQKTKQGNHSPQPSTHTKNPNQPKIQQKCQILGEFSNPLNRFVMHCYMGRDGVLKVKCIFTILKLIIFPFLIANIINQFIHSITIKCMHWQEITEHTLIISIIIMTQIQQSN